MSLGSNKELAENKLILLYIIDKINIPITNLQVTKLILENKLMNYFLLQQYLDDLCADSLLSHKQEENKIFYTISVKGKQTLGYFTNLIPAGIRSRIDNTMKEIKKKIRNETSITADFTPENENEHVVHCKVNEDDFLLIDLKVTVGSKTDARSICDNWKKYHQAIYSEIIDSLTRKRE